MTDKVSSKSLQGKCLTFYPFAGFFFLHTFSPAFTAACGKKKLLGFSVLLKRMASWRKKRSSMGVVVTDVTGV